jgi:hypothetical protein
MAFKPNYGRQRADRARAQEEKREEKLRRRQERSNERKAQAAAEDSKQGPASGDTEPGQAP